jgi:class 3 adenylate cyclase/predicted ATPase
VWLEKLGMSEYADRFAENDIDIEVLGELTDADFDRLGVSIGHRRKLLKALAAGALTAATAPQSSPLASSLTLEPSQIDEVARPVAVSPEVIGGERRHLTVMFCDLVDSTGISARLDAEEWRDLVGAYLHAASRAVEEMGGKVAKKLGDGLMALFGYPVAQENDAERAVRAAVLIQRSLAELNRQNEGTGRPALVARIAIDSGPVVIDADGEIFGDVPNIAARAQALAEPGGVVITARVQRQVAGLFVAEERGSHQLKGVPEPLTLFRIVRASGGGRRAGQRHLTPLVGRDEEIAMLMRRWERARQGDGQLVLIMGEPGLGKSRLIEEFHARLGETPHTWVEWSCSQLLQNTSLHPITEWGRQRFGGADVPSEQRLTDLRSSLTQVNLAAAENAALLAPLLDIPLTTEPALPSEELRRRQLAALTSWVMAGARAQPIVLAIEDVQWADPTTLDLLRGIAERGALVPLLVLITARPEFRASWGMRSHHGMIALAPLDGQQVRQMVGGLASRHALPKEVIDGVTERAGGVPLFVEEVTRLLLERREQVGDGQNIPPTLQQSLTARLDRLGPARELAQIGSVIGRDFSYALLRAVAGIDDALLQSRLDRLAEADIFLVQGVPPDSEYRFKHALIQDAAYENLLKSRRQLLHRRVGEVLRDNISVAPEPELLAHHFNQAGMSEAAIEWWDKAGHRSLERSAVAEASAQFTRALDQIAALTSTSALRRKEVELQVAQITPLMHIKGYAAPETKAAVQRARSLIEQLDSIGERLEDPLLLFAVLLGFWTASFVAFNGDKVCELAAQFLDLADKQPTIAPRLVAHRLMGSSRLFTGDIQEAAEHYGRVIELYDPVEDRQHATRFSIDARVAALSFRAWALWLLGYPDAALADAEQGLKDAREIGHAASLMHTLANTPPTLIHCGCYEAALELLNELGLLANEKGASLWKAIAEILQGRILGLTGEASDAVQMITSGLSAIRATGATIWEPQNLSHLAWAYARSGRFDEAMSCIRDALAVTEKSKERWSEAEVNRIAGEIALKSLAGDPFKAQSYFDRALTIARAQQAKSWELRAAMSMARLWRDQGKRTEARELLAAVYGWFTEGFDTLDLREAKALLAELC